MTKYMSETDRMWHNLRTYFELADSTDITEGMVAYERYNIVMRRIAEKYEYPLDATCAVFCSLSPNSDYWGNLRSTVSVLQGINEARVADDITVSTYGHCKLRAVAYATGAKSFTEETRGPKILNFYHNILRRTRRVGDNRRAHGRGVARRPQGHDAGSPDQAARVSNVRGHSSSSSRSPTSCSRVRCRRSCGSCASACEQGL
jgi:hypothetical protein